ncbi:dihydroxyacetone kinase subunit DhaK [Nocardia macrotermitis]|uniref:PEP-dependent dihydroxyacetone kinase, dihydroxyacetone-binding subunit DhaK n=1 Tax=Nocardia macrotermitis TaxID=2585198 RepID=A0A7K0CTY6_9NOCA|nr:dihydroxyacetone kinase subunit DhaK [Nocardia macrotermitis]MQY16939.1 PEP-dependent dihydroxyacetone kinase, dihydroxyacetone-binding subunit DhaK [Nocardia macrotermitis]
MSYFAHSPDDLVDRALAGFARAHAETVSYTVDPGYLSAVDPARGRVVGLVSGGGSGHEPMHGGFVGRGMLDAACPGRVFASPHNRQVYEASRAVAKSGGVLHIVKNYTGDRINFAIAAERMQHDGIACERVLVDDDVATDSEDIAVGRRGTGATVIVEKLLGAAADEGRSLSELAGLGKRIVDASRSIAVASAAQTAPGTGQPAFELPRGAIEYGVGIHGERSGLVRADGEIDALVGDMTVALISALGLGSGSRVIVLVNGLGRTTQMELYGAFDRLATILEQHGITLERRLVGSLVTALDMRGFSLSLTRTDDELTRLWDAPAHTAAWPTTTRTGEDDR